MSVELVGVLNERARCGLQLVEVIDRGQSGAAVVRWPDGRKSVVTTAFSTLERMRLTADVLGDVRELGLPVPRHEFLLEVSAGTVAVVQEWLPGAVRTVVDVQTVAGVVAINDQFAGLLRHRPDVPPVVLQLGGSGDDRVDLVRSHGPRARRLVDRIRACDVDTASGLVEDDLVHVDLTVPNMLFGSAGSITGVIDWNSGVARGDRRFGLVKLLHNLSFAALAHTPELVPTPEAVAYLDAVVAERLPRQMLDRYWGHHTLNLLYASRRWGTEDAFLTHLLLGESRLGGT